MAGDWLKMEAATPDKPEVLAIAARMGWDDPDLAVGKLFRVWRWFDQHTTNGNAPGVTFSLLDRIAGVSGFAFAMQSVGWLSINDEGLMLPGFEKHCGKTAKERAQTARRVASHKEKHSGNGKVTPTPLPTALPREDKRIRSTPLTPQPKGFAEFWGAYPRKVGKVDAERAWLKTEGVELSVVLQAVERARATEQWRKDGGQFIPHPATWLRQRRWEDETPQDPEQQAGQPAAFAGAV